MVLVLLLLGEATNTKGISERIRQEDFGNIVTLLLGM